MKTIDDTARETAQEMGYKEPASTTDSSNGNSMMTPQNSLNDMAQSGVKEMKNMFDGVAPAPAPGDFLNSTWEHVRSLMGGGGGGEEDNGNGEGMCPVFCFVFMCIWFTFMLIEYLGWA